MKFFIFNEKSFLNNGMVRAVNTIILTIIVFAISNATILPIPHWVCLFIPAVSSLICSYAVFRVLSETDFFEWDYTERQKKRRFTVAYTLICGFLSSMFVFSIVIAYSYLILSPVNISIIGALFFVIPIIFFGFNICNIISLYYPLFDDYLTISYKIQKKPKNWQDKGREINNDDEIEEIIHRDFGV